MSQYFNRYKDLFEYEAHTTTSEMAALNSFLLDASSDITSSSVNVNASLPVVLHNSRDELRSVPMISPRIRLQQQQMEQHVKKEALLDDKGMFHHKVLFSPMRSMSLKRPAPPSDYGIVSPMNRATYPEKDLLARAIDTGSRKPKHLVNSPRQRLAILSESIKNGKRGKVNGNSIVGGDSEPSKQQQTEMQQIGALGKEDVSRQPELVGAIGELQQEQLAPQGKASNHEGLGKQSNALTIPETPRQHAKQSLESNVNPHSRRTVVGILPETGSRELKHRPHRRPRATIVAKSPQQSKEAVDTKTAMSAGIPLSYDLVPFNGTDRRMNITHPLGKSSPRNASGILPGDDNESHVRARSPRRGSGAAGPATESESDLKHVLWSSMTMRGTRGSKAGGSFNTAIVPKKRLVLLANTEEERQAMMRRIQRWLHLSTEARRIAVERGCSWNFSGMEEDLPPAILRRHHAVTSGLEERRQRLVQLFANDKAEQEYTRKRKSQMNLGNIPFRIL